MMQIKIIIILNIYLFFKQLFQTALSIISSVFLNKILKNSQVNLFCNESKIEVLTARKD